MNCAECQQSATVYNGGVPLCGTCFYKRSVGPEAVAGSPVPEEVWKRLSEAIVALELLVARIGGEMDELAKDKKSAQ